MLEAILDPQCASIGLRNRDIVDKLYAQPTVDRQEKRRRSARVTRLIRLLRAHSLMQKIPKEHRYQLCAEARKRITAVLVTRNTNVETLAANAA